MPTTTTSGSSAAITASSFAKPGVGRRPLERSSPAVRRCRSGRRRRRRCARSRSRARAPSREGGDELVAAGGERLAHRVDVLAACLGERRAAAAATADDRAELADDLRPRRARRASCRGSRRAPPCPRRPRRARPPSASSRCRTWSEKSRSALPRAPVTSATNTLPCLSCQTMSGRRRGLRLRLLRLAPELLELARARRRAPSSALRAPSTPHRR